MAVPNHHSAAGLVHGRGGLRRLAESDGAPVKAGEPLFTLESDKASQEVEATRAAFCGLLPAPPRPATRCWSGRLLGYLVDEGESLPPAEAPPSLGAAGDVGADGARQTRAIFQPLTHLKIDRPDLSLESARFAANWPMPTTPG